MKNVKIQKRLRRHNRIRSHLAGSASRPRLTVLRSLKKNYAQLVDDTTGRVLAAQNDTQFAKTGTKSQRAKMVGLAIAKKALEKGITTCVFDRSGHKYHGRVKAIALGAREGGLKF